MHNGAANTVFVNVSNIGCGTSAKTRPQSTNLHLGKLHVLPCLFFTQHAKSGVGQVERTHTRTLLRNAHLDTITVTKTCSNSSILEPRGGGVSRKT